MYMYKNVCMYMYMYMYIYIYMYMYMYMHMYMYMYMYTQTYRQIDIQTYRYTYPVIEKRVGEQQRRRRALIALKRHQRGLRVFPLLLHASSAH